MNLHRKISPIFINSLPLIPLFLIYKIPLRTQKALSIITTFPVLNITLVSQIMSPTIFILGLVSISPHSPFEYDDTSPKKYTSHTWYQFHCNIWCDTHCPLDGSYESRIQILGMWIYSSIQTYIPLSMRSNIVWRLLAYYHSTQQ